jgi:hypothetical protein
MLNSVVGASNTILPGSDPCRRVRSVLNDAELELRYLETEMKELVVQLAKLNNKRTQHLTRMDKLHCAIAPHKYLPPEVIANFYPRILEAGACSTGGAYLLKPSQAQISVRYR